MTPRAIGQVRLNLGSSDHHIDGWISVDLHRPDNAPLAFQIADLASKWPWETSSIDEVLAQDVIEHIADRIHFMNELHRVLKPNSRATIVTPNASRGAGYFQDPSHRSPWCLNSFQYFQAGSFAHNRLAKSYGITAAFKIVHLSESLVPDVCEPVWKITAVLEACK